MFKKVFDKLSENKSENKGEKKNEDTNENTNVNKDESNNKNKAEDKKETNNENKGADNDKSDRDNSNKNNNEKNSEKNGEDNFEEKGINKSEGKSENDDEKNCENNGKVNDTSENKDKNNTKNKKEDKKEETQYCQKSENNKELTSKNIKSILEKNSDFNLREIYICGDKNRPVTLIYMDGLVHTKTVSDDIIKPLMQEEKLAEAKTEKEVINMIEHGFVFYPTQKTRDTIKDTISDILNGFSALIFDCEHIALTFETKGFEKRSISEPSEENAVKSPKDTFIENIRDNTATLRRKIKSQNLIIEQTIVGKQTLTPIAIVYMDGLTNKNLVDSVKKRLDGIDIDGVIETGFVEEYIIDSKYSLFPQILYTERPDKFCINLLDGSVGILIDGIPIAYNVPGVMHNFLRAPNDYSQNYFIASFIRLLRLFLIWVSLFLPAVYISVLTFHQEMIPTELALSIAASKEGVPYPAFVEVFFMLIAFEVLLEAGLRMPKNIGQAVSIVGALVVGEAAVSAKLISPAVVIVVAITAISSFAIPNQDFSNAIRMWRILIAILSSALGLCGMTFGAIFLLYHLATIETFGVPYLSPFAANEGKDLQYGILRFPLFTLKRRPSMLKPVNKRRQK